MARLALTDDDARVRRWFSEEVKQLGCSLVVDQMGNMFAKRPGMGKIKAPMIAMGSHLDTQPCGGRYDGILGVLAGIEVLRTLQENHQKTNFDIGVVNWTKRVSPTAASAHAWLLTLVLCSEEGARFPKSMVSSGVWAGAIPINEAWNLQDIVDPSSTIKSELQRIGYFGNVACSSDPTTGIPLSAHFELHIEQGPILERARKKIGLVQGAQAYKWLTITVIGRDAHTGTTPLETRKDSLLAAAKMISSSHAIAKRHGSLASTGIFKIPPNSSTNTICSRTSFTLDIRHPDDAVVAQVSRLCLESFQEICKEDGQGVSLHWTLDTDSPAVKFDRECIQAAEAAANCLVGPDGWLPITSGAGHDSVYTSIKCPTTMIFVPCKDGVSHHPEEYCSLEDW